MKVLTKILNVIVIIFVIIGIYSTINFIVERNKPQIDYNYRVDSLQNIIEQKERLLEENDSLLEIAEVETNKYYKLWQERKVHVNQLKKQLKESQNQNKVKNLPLDEMVAYIIDYFDTDTTQAQIMQNNDSIYVVVTPKLMSDIGVTIAEHQDNLKMLEAYQAQVYVCDTLVDKLINENNILTASKEFLEDINKELKQKEKEVLQQHKEEVKKLKFQRNIIAIAEGVAIILLIAL